MAEQSVSISDNSNQSEKKVKKSKRSKSKKSREIIILPNVDSLKEKIISSVVEIGRQKEYFTYDDVFSGVVSKINIDLNNVKKIKTLYNCIIRVMLEMENEGYFKGYAVPETRKVYWKLIKSLF
ncbi:MAG: hypothetical protein ACP5IE_10505 [Infirmifilum sp.]|jgi:hypothetical protein